MASSASNEVLNPNAFCPEETLRYRLQLSYLLAPLSKGRFATQPHLIDSQQRITTPLHSSNMKLTCPACQATLIVGVNAAVRTHRARGAARLWRLCLGCRNVSKDEGTQGNGDGRERFPSVKQRTRRKEAAVSASQTGTESIQGTSSRMLAKAVTDLPRTRVPDHAMQRHETTTATSQTGLLRVVPTAAPSSASSPAPSKASFTSEARVKPPTTHRDQAKSTNKRSKTTSGLAELLAAKKLEREKANQAGGASGGMGLQQFLQSI